MVLYGESARTSTPTWYCATMAMGVMSLVTSYLMLGVSTWLSSAPVESEAML